MKTLVIACFLDEEDHLPRFLDSIGRQVRRPDRLLLVDDGSTDSSGRLAREFCEEADFAELLSRPPRPTEADRLATAAELKAFQWGLARARRPYDIVVKMDADLDLTPTLFEFMEGEFRRNPDLGVAGAYLSREDKDGSTVREHCPPSHVRGPNKFYRGRCYEQIQPVLPFLGWDTVDEVRARMRGWETRSYALPDGDPIHLRPTGEHDGTLRAYRRWGECAYGYGADPMFTVLRGVAYCGRRPAGLPGLHYLWGWIAAGMRHAPRANEVERRYFRAEQRARLRAAAITAWRPRLGGRPAWPGGGGADRGGAEVPDERPVP